jgi:anionic cell wall polymer biosynthesis LytR-Cps2A-Psr (LCP) family protein
MKTNLYIVNVVTCKLAKIQYEILSIMRYTKVTISNKIYICKNINNAAPTRSFLGMQLTGLRGS